MNRRGFFGKLAAIVATLGFGKLAGAAPKTKCVPHVSSFAAILGEPWREYEVLGYCAARPIFLDKDNRMHHVISGCSPRAHKLTLPQPLPGFQRIRFDAQELISEPSRIYWQIEDVEIVHSIG